MGVPPDDRTIFAITSWVQVVEYQVDETSFQYRLLVYQSVPVSASMTLIDHRIGIDAPQQGPIGGTPFNDAGYQYTPGH